MNKYNKTINEQQDDIALQAGALFFQEEMLEQAEMIDVDALISELNELKDEGIDMLSWKELYPILKTSVI